MVMEGQQYAAIFRSEKPHETEAFKDLLAQVAVAENDALLRPFLSELNKAIADTQHSYTESLVTWALELIRTLISANHMCPLKPLPLDCRGWVVFAPQVDVSSHGADPRRRAGDASWDLVPNG